MSQKAFINATRADNKVMDAENLCCKTDSSSTTINQQGTAMFTLENYSSAKVTATASFKAEGDFKGTASYDVANGKETTVYALLKWANCNYKLST